MSQRARYMLARMRTLLICLALAAAAHAEAPAPVAPAPDAAIRKLLADQETAWNRGDLEGYMAGYWRSPELTFYSNSTEARGWQPTLERYRKRYQSAGAEMGKLDFPSLAIEVLGDAAIARGRWHLALSKGKEAKGMFTLLLRKLPEGWRIVHDHSSG